MRASSYGELCKRCGASLPEKPDAERFMRRQLVFGRRFDFRIQVRKCPGCGVNVASTDYRESE